jgi:hypothetical protein
MVGEWLIGGKWSWPNQHWHFLKRTEKPVENLGQGLEIRAYYCRVYCYVNLSSGVVDSVKFLACTLCSGINMFGIWNSVTSHNADTTGCHSVLKCNMFTRRWLSPDTEWLQHVYLPDLFLFFMWLFVRCGWVKWKKGLVAFFQLWSITCE